jgi:hypothetical protein
MTMNDRHQTSRADLSRDEAKMLAKVREEVARIAAQARDLAPDELPQFVARRVDRFTAPMAEVSERFAHAVARHISLEVRRLLTH